MNGIFRALALSLLLTLVAEAAFFLLIGKRKRDLLLVLLVNVVTNPVVVLVYWLCVALLGAGPVLVTAALEASAVALEGHYYRRYGEDFRHPFLLSVAANAISFGAGLLLRNL